MTQPTNWTEKEPTLEELIKLSVYLHHSSVSDGFFGISNGEAADNKKRRMVIHRMVLAKADAIIKERESKKQTGS